jgi:hypothetical protein
VVATTFALCVATGGPGATAAPGTPVAGRLEPVSLPLPPEVPDDPPGAPAKPVPGAPKAAVVTFGRFTHIQVNVDANGANIPGDAANEPSIAVDPTDHDVMAIGWRQFDTIASNFREAGYGWSSDGGASWTRGEIESGVFRSDPVLSSDGQGKFYYSSLSTSGGFVCRLFPSSDGGMTWGPSSFAYGGDKQWIAIDRTGGMGHDNVYQAWSTASNPTAPNTFNRSVDGGASFQAPTFIPSSPVWGTLDVASDGTLYVVGTGGVNAPTYVARSTNAQNPVATPSFTTVSPNLGGTLGFGGPNPAGLLGQLWIAVDRSNGPRAGWIYVLASVVTPSDPMDVHFIRSTDGGQTWSAPVRVNDDPAGNGAWQWFGTMSVSPDGRIDAVWNDSRASGQSTLTALYYASSQDGGVTWSPNEQASPIWNSTLGWPNQNKIGDYYHMVSDAGGADLAWAATFNGEEDVYYVRIQAQTAAVAGPVPGRTRLHPGLPNPSASTTTIRFDMPAGGGRARLQVFDAGGRRVATLVDGPVGGGTQAVHWAGTDEAGRAVRPGVYLCRLDAEGVRETRKLMRIR